MSNPFGKGNPSVDFRTWQKANNNGISEDFSADARRYNQKNIEWTDNKAIYEGGDGFYCRMNGGTYFYRIFFNTDENSIESILDKFPVNNRSKQEVISLIKKTFEEINIYKIGSPVLQFEFDAAVNYDRQIKVSNGDIYGTLYFDAPKLRGSILCNFQNRDGSVAGSTGFKNNWFFVFLSIGDSYVKDDEKFKYTLKHELLHNFGLDHEYPAYSTEYRKETKDSIVYSFYNEQINFSKLAPDFKTLELNKDKLCWLDTIYNTDRVGSGVSVGWNWKIKGQISNLPLNYNEDFNYESGHCEALLINLDTMEYEYRMPIDYTGYFEFRLRTPSENLKKYGLLVVSSHWNYKRIIEYEDTKHDEFEPENFWVNNKNDWSQGYVYYFFDDKSIQWVSDKAINVGESKGIIPSLGNNVWSFRYKIFNNNSGEISFVYVHANKRAISLQDLENKTGVKNIYAYFVNIEDVSAKSLMRSRSDKYLTKSDFKCSHSLKKRKIGKK